MESGALHLFRHSGRLSPGRAQIDGEMLEALKVLKSRVGKLQTGSQASSRLPSVQGSARASSRLPSSR